MRSEKFVLDWRKKQRAKQAVRLCVEDGLDKVARAYTPNTFERKCDLTSQHVYDAYAGDGKSVYAVA